jgi:hypothetical protein
MSRVGLSGLGPKWFTLARENRSREAPSMATKKKAKKKKH